MKYPNFKGITSGFHPADLPTFPAQAASRRAEEVRIQTRSKRLRVMKSSHSLWFLEFLGAQRCLTHLRSKNETYKYDVLFCLGWTMDYIFFLFSMTMDVHGLFCLSMTRDYYCVFFFKKPSTEDVWSNGPITGLQCFRRWKGSFAILWHGVCLPLMIFLSGQPKSADKDPKAN